MVAPGFGAAGFGIALVAVGGVLVAKGNDLAGLALDALGIIFSWSAFKMRRG